LYLIFSIHYQPVAKDKDAPYRVSPRSAGQVDAR
jgi:hypothetical protein